MKSTIFLFMLFTATFLKAQTPEQIERINNILDSVPYFEIRGLERYSEIDLPDSTKAKALKALRRELPQHFADKVFTLPDETLNNIERFAWNECKNDTICFEKVFAERLKMNIEAQKRFFYSRCLSQSLVSASGSWGIVEAIPYLEKELEREDCTDFGMRVFIEMALAKLGNDSVKQVLLERYTLSYVLRTTALDTINNNARTREVDILTFWQEGIHTAMYLQSKEMLLNILDFIYIRGLTMFCFGSECDETSMVSLFIMNFCDSSNFRNFPNFERLREICDGYRRAIWRLEDKRRNRREQRELDRLLSTEYRTMIKNQIRDWIIENVNFDE